MSCCLFYGFNLVRIPRDGYLVPIGLPRVNQCALITGEVAPCAMESCGIAPDWELCNRNPANNGNYTPITCESKGETDPVLLALDEDLAQLVEAGLLESYEDCGLRLFRAPTEREERTRGAC